MMLAERMGIKAPASELLKKAAQLGLRNATDFEWLAVAQGCWHYRQPQMPEPLRVDESQFSNEELSIALLSPSQPYSPHVIRLGAAMLAAVGNSAERLVSLAKAESCASQVILGHFRCLEREGN